MIALFFVTSLSSHSLRPAYSLLQHGPASLLLITCLFPAGIEETDAGQFKAFLFQNFNLNIAEPDL